MPEELMPDPNRSLPQNKKKCSMNRNIYEACCIYRPAPKLEENSRPKSMSDEFVPDPVHCPITRGPTKISARSLLLDMSEIAVCLSKVLKFCKF